MKIEQVPSLGAAVERVVGVTVAGIVTAWRDGRDAHIVLTGGRSGAAVCEELRNRLPEVFVHVLHVWIADERFVEFDSVDRNDTAMINALPQHEQLIVHRHLPPSQSTLEESADAYAHDLTDTLANRPFDVVVLSVGEDGHVASVFPGHPQPNVAAYAESASPKPPAQRTTISLVRLANATTCEVLAVGESKQSVVNACRTGDLRLPVVQLAATVPLTLVTDLA